MKVLFFGGFGTTTRDYQKLEQYLTNRGVSVMFDNQGLGAIKPDMVIGHSYGALKALHFLSTSEIKKRTLTILISPTFALPSLNFWLLTKAVTGYVVSKIIARQLPVILDWRRNFRRVPVIDYSKDTTEKVVILTATDGIVPYELQTHYTKQLLNVTEVLVFNSNHDLLDRNTQEIAQLILQLSDKKLVKVASAFRNPD